MGKGPDASRREVNDILSKEGPLNGNERNKLRNFFLTAEAGCGNTPLHLRTQITVGRIREVLGLPLNRAQQKLRTLAERQASGEVDAELADWRFFFTLNEERCPLCRKHLLSETGKQAIVLTRKRFDQLRCIEILHKSGEAFLIDSYSLDPDDVLIFYPEDLADVPPPPPREEPIVEAAVPTEAEMIAEKAMAELDRVFPRVLEGELPKNADWDAILTTYKSAPALALIEGAKRSVPQGILARYAYLHVKQFVLRRQYGVVARFLRNLKMGDEGAIAFFDQIS